MPALAVSSQQASILLRQRRNSQPVSSTQQWTGSSLEFPHVCPSFVSNNHLRNTLPTKRLAIHECLPSNPGKEIAKCSNKQDNSGSDQGGNSRDDREPLDEGHDAVDGGAHVVGLEAADEAIEGGGGRADSE